VTTKRLSGDPQVVWAAFSWRGLPSNTKNELLASIRAVKLDVPVSCYVERAALRCVMQVVVGDAMHWAPSIERQIFKCPACPQGARRLVFSGPPIHRVCEKQPGARRGPAPRREARDTSGAGLAAQGMTERDRDAATDVGRYFWLKAERDGSVQRVSASFPFWMVANIRNAEFRAFPCRQGRGLTVEVSLRGQGTEGPLSRWRN
jgi:hypothetical protein